MVLIVISSDQLSFMNKWKEVNLEAWIKMVLSMIIHSIDTSSILFYAVEYLHALSSILVRLICICHTVQKQKHVFLTETQCMLVVFKAQ